MSESNSIIGCCGGGVEVITRWERGEEKTYSFDGGKTWLTPNQLKEKQIQSLITAEIIAELLLLEDKARDEDLGYAILERIKYYKAKETQ